MAELFPMVERFGERCGGSHQKGEMHHQSTVTTNITTIITITITITITIITIPLCHHDGEEVG